MLLDEDELELELLELLLDDEDDDESPKKALIRLRVKPRPEALDPLELELELLESLDVAAELLLPLLLLLALLLLLPLLCRLPDPLLRSLLLLARLAAMNSSRPRNTSPSSKSAGKSFLRTLFCSGANLRRRPALLGLPLRAFRDAACARAVLVVSLGAGGTMGSSRGGMPS